MSFQRLTDPKYLARMTEEGFGATAIITAVDVTIVAPVGMVWNATGTRSISYHDHWDLHAAAGLAMTDLERGLRA